MNYMKEQLSTNYPKTPEHFRKVVEHQVEIQMQQEQYTTLRKSTYFFKTIIPFLACLIMCCSVVLTAGIKGKGIGSWLETLGVNRNNAEKLVQLNPDVIYEEENPLLSIKEFYADGTKLVFIAQADKSLQGYEINVKDHIMVNDIDCMNMGFYPLEGEDDLYECSIDISEVPKADSLCVDLNVYTPDGVSGTMFTLYLKTMNETKELQEYTYLFDEGFVKLERGTVSPTMLDLSLYFECNGENAEKNIKILAGYFYKVVDSKGNVLDTSYVIRDWGISENSADYVEKNGVWSKSIEFQIEKFDVNSENITFIPYEADVDEFGKSIPDSGVVYDEWAFMIPLIKVIED